MMSQANRVDSSSLSAVQNRILSVDALRGFDMFWIAGTDELVHGLTRIDNSPLVGFVSIQLRHCRWEGFHFYDLIFPLFVFLVGISTVFSLDKIIAKEGQYRAHVRIIRRFVLLFLLGAFKDSGISDLAHESPFSGVLQRIAWCYLFTALLYCHLSKRALIAVCVSILVGYWALLTFVPVPGRVSASYAEDQNIVNWFDQKYLPMKEQGQHWDPEGLLSTIPAVSSCLLGLFAGLAMRDSRGRSPRLALQFIVIGVAMTSLGYLWGMQFPIIKAIWTSSYVLVAGGYSFTLIGLFSLIIDTGQYRRWAIPFVWIGANPLTIYLAVDFVNFHEISNRIVGGPIEHVLGAYEDTLIAAVALLCVILFARFLYKRQIFLRV